jgi:hypothetical protein
MWKKNQAPSMTGGRAEALHKVRSACWAQKFSMYYLG